MAALSTPQSTFMAVHNGYASFAEIAAMIAGLPDLGGRTTSIPIETVIAQYGETGRLGVASNSYVLAANARRLGWSPRGLSLGEWMSASSKGSNDDAT